jgi:hypothetical protein
MGFEADARDEMPERWTAELAWRHMNAISNELNLGH